MSRLLTRFFGPPETPIAPRAGLVGGLISLVAAAMAFLAVAAFEAGVAADRVAGRWSGELAKSATVRITAPAEDAQAVTAAALRVLEIAPGIASARILSETENQALLSPWLGRDADVAALPLPILIDITVSGRGPDAADIQRQLELAAPGAVYDDHGEWRAPLITAARGLRIIAGIGVALTVVALAVMVAMAASATLWSGSAVVRTLRLIGAEDRMISRAFERPFALRAAFGAACGAALALIFVEQMPRIDGVDALIAGASGYGPTWWLAPLAPLVAGLTALIATRIAAFVVLRRS
ncbi:MAG: cell division protein FtsX [Pseudomonadota bacterium]